MKTLIWLEIQCPQRSCSHSPSRTRVLHPMAVSCSQCVAPQCDKWTMPDFLQQCPWPQHSLYPPPSTDGDRDSPCHWQMHSWCCSVSGFLVPSLYRVLQCVFSDISRYIKNITFTLGGLHSVYLSQPSFDFVLISVQYTFLLKPWELTAVNI